jgi:putative transposase
MYLADTTVLSRMKYPEICGKMEEFLRLSKDLYNAALFRIRQVFTGWDKEKRTGNEEEVFGEIRAMQAVYPHVKVGRVLSYRALDAIMRANGNPDFFAGLPMQTAQRVLKEAVTVFKAWLSSLKEFRRAPERYTGRPCMPKYLKGDRHTVYISNQDAVLYPVYREGGRAGNTGSACGGSAGMELKLPHIRKRIFLRHISADSILKEVQVRPYYGKLLLILVLETEDLPAGGEKPHLAGIDLGTDNIAAIVSTDRASRIYKGGAVLSVNRYFQKKKAQAVGTITKGTARKHADSARLRRLSLHHDCFMKDMMHKVSTDIVRYCVEHKVGTIVMGVNRGWKQGVGMGKVNNQNFTGIPHEELKKMILYKAARAGIRIIEQEESYTSKADITAMDPMPVYGREDGRPVFSGRRIKRGLYACSAGYTVNADCSGAANILRKAVPEAWKGTEDFRFLAEPEKAGFMDLQRARTA